MARESVVISPTDEGSRRRGTSRLLARAGLRGFAGDHGRPGCIAGFPGRADRSRLAAADARLLPAAFPPWLDDSHPFFPVSDRLRRAVRPPAQRHPVRRAPRAPASGHRPPEIALPGRSALPDRFPLFAPDFRADAPARAGKADDRRDHRHRRRGRPVPARRPVALLAAQVRADPLAHARRAAGARAAGARLLRVDHGFRDLLVDPRPPADHPDDVGPEGKLRLERLCHRVCAECADGQGAGAAELRRRCAGRDPPRPDGHLDA